MAITREEVAAIIDVEESDDLQAFLIPANIIRRDHLSGLEAETADQCEIWLAAHFAAMKYERGSLTRDRQGDAEQAYQVTHTDYQGLSQTRYGRTAIMLDSTGSLSSLASSARKAHFRVV